MLKIKELFYKIINLFENFEVFYINDNESLPPPLDKDEENKIINDYFNGSSEARDLLIVHNLRLVVYVAKRYETDVNNLEDDPVLKKDIIGRVVFVVSFCFILE